MGDAPTSAASEGVSAADARAKTRRRRFLLAGGLVLVLVVLLGTLAYRLYYHVWPGQGPGSRVSWCGRDYDYYTQDNSPLSLRQIQASYGRGYQVAGSYPLLPPRSQVVSPGCDPTVPTVIFFSVGTDQYVAYGLSGGP